MSDVTVTGMSDAPTGERRGRVLVIDDEPLIGKSIRRALASRHDVEVHVDAREALEHIAGGARFDVVFCDLMMPNMTGIEFFGELSKLAPDVAARVIFLVGGAFTPAAKSFLERVENTRLDKPFQLKDLEAVVAARVR